MNCCDLGEYCPIWNSEFVDGAPEILQDNLEIGLTF